jgi:hypothetical protein
MLLRRTSGSEWFTRFGGSVLLQAESRALLLTFKGPGVSEGTTWSEDWGDSAGDADGTAWSLAGSEDWAAGSGDGLQGVVNILAGTRPSVVLHPLFRYDQHSIMQSEHDGECMVQFLSQTDWTGLGFDFECGPHRTLAKCWYICTKERTSKKTSPVYNRIQHGGRSRWPICVSEALVFSPLLKKGLSTFQAYYIGNTCKLCGKL